MRVEDTTARTDDETGTLTVPSKILPRVFMQMEYDSCRGVKPALPPTSATPCYAVRNQSCQVRSTANSNALVMLCVSCLVSVSNVK